MENKITDIFSRRLRQARLMKGLSLENLTQVMNPSVSRQAINKYEKGTMMPDSKILIALAAALGVKIDYFFRPFTVEVDKIEFSKNSDFPERKISAIREQIREILERYLEVENLCGCGAEFSLTRKEISNTPDVVDTASHLRSILGLGNDGISNVIEVLEENGIKVIEVDEAATFKGLSGYANQTIPLLVVNRNFSPENKRFTALHELAHLLFVFPDSFTAKEKERACNLFASEMLLPSNILKAKVGESRHNISLSELIDIQRQFGISIDDIMNALTANGIISHNRLAGYTSKKSRMSDFKELVEKSRFPIEYSGRFMRMVYRALASELISLSKAAVLLNSSVDKVNSQLQLV